MQQPDAKETKLSYGKIWERKAEWIKIMKKELKDLEEGSGASIHLKSLRATLRKVPNWKTPGQDGIHGFWSLKSTTE